MNLNSLWSILEEGFDPLNEDAYSVWQKIAAEQSFEPGWMTWLSAIFVFGAEPFSTAAFMCLFPYGSASVLESRFASASRQGVLTAGSENEYCATEKGRQLTNQMIHAATASMLHFQPVSPENLQKIVSYAKRLAEASLSAPEPPARFGVTHYYKNMHPGDAAPLIRRYLHYFGTLDKYRGNAHLASWQPYNIEGNRWEVLTYLWKGRLNTLDTLFEELKFRGITRAEYAHILQELAGRGWIEEVSAEYHLTAEGRRIREEAEALTDRYFFAPWACLSEAEQQDLMSLATQLRDGLRNSSQ